MGWTKLGAHSVRGSNFDIFGGKYASITMMDLTQQKIQFLEFVILIYRFDNSLLFYKNNDSHVS